MDPPIEVKPMYFPYLRLHVMVLEAEPRMRRRREPFQTLCPRPKSDSSLGSPLLRRVLGKALVDAFCPFGKPLCQDKPAGSPRAESTARCFQAASCPYGVLIARSRTQRPPFALYVAPETESEHRTIELTLYGLATFLYSWTLVALDRALRTGLGRNREKWHIDRVFKVLGNGERQPLCGRDLSVLSPTVEPERLCLDAPRAVEPQPVTVDLLSPTRLVRDGRLVPKGENVTFDLLVARILDRFREIYGDGASDLLRPDLRTEIEDAASHVPLLRDQSRWIEVHDYSARTRSELNLGGLSGRFLFGETASSFLPLLRVGEIIHLGKNPASGCGRIRVRVNGHPQS